MNKETFINSLENLNIEVTDDKLKKLDEYASFLLEYNKHTNLTAIRDIEGLYLKHFYDSLTITNFFDLNTISSLVDVGTGAGFPGMVLKIFFPHLNVTLIDSNNKKVTFLSELIKKLELNNIKALNIRSEEFAKNHRDEFDIATARAVTSMPVLSELCLPLVKVGGYFIPLKAEVREELQLATAIIKDLQGEIESINEFNLPIEESKRTIIKIKKTGKTPDKYPRSYDKMKKALKKLTK